MDISTKHHLAEKLLMEKDVAILDQIRALLEVDQGDWWDSASKTFKDSIEVGIRQLDNNEGIPHDEVIKKMKTRFLR